MKLTLGFSPCPNDTFIFDAMVNGGVDTHGITFEYVMEDVETLNQWAMDGRLHITKLSYSTFLHTVHRYALLHSGSALGQGVGPLLVARHPLDMARLHEHSIAIPGIKTTANLLLSLAYPQAKNKTELLFSDIEAAVLDGRYDAGLIIHESRFTYAQKGLIKLADLGDWWEQATGAAIPLGGIVMRRDLGAELCATVDGIIRKSLELSWQRYPQLSQFVKENAQEMEEEVMRKHIDLYVNSYTTDLGDTGRNAIATLFSKAKEAGLIPYSANDNIFY
ncbi:1,4-dihydroxy-6-naphthoate synthase [Nemorincola caseinilytica]|uniref:1,4-dihydroxy-6-naphtoate synthase n=1 Tax=Nemorincola caseinilytica TaxID=2054315 RepID=A0ABP8NAP4_9BACT